MLLQKTGEKAAETTGLSGVVDDYGTAAGTSLALAGTKAYLTSRVLDKALNAADFREGGTPGLVRRSLYDMLRTRGGSSPEHLARYADAASGFLSGNVSDTYTGKQALSILGKFMRSKGIELSQSRFVPEAVGRTMRGYGTGLMAAKGSAHFNSFGSPGEGIRRLVEEVSGSRRLSIGAVSEMIRRSLASHGYVAGSGAARRFDKTLRSAIRNGNSEFPLSPAMERDIVPILRDIVNKSGRGATTAQIAAAIAPGASLDSTLYDAIRGLLSRSRSSRAETAALSRSIAGRIAMLGATTTSRFGSVRHGRELAAFALVKALRSRAFRGTAAAVGLSGAALAAYSAIMRRST